MKKSGTATATNGSVKDAAPVQQFVIRPINQWVLIRKHTEGEKTTDAGVVIPEGQLRSQRGLVLSAPAEMILPNGTMIPFPVEAGDVVIYTNFPIELEDLEQVTGEKDLHLVRYEEIYAVIEPVEAD